MVIPTLRMTLLRHGNGSGAVQRPFSMKPDLLQGIGSTAAEQFIIIYNQRVPRRQAHILLLFLGPLQI